MRIPLHNTLAKLGITEITTQKDMDKLIAQLDKIYPDEAKNQPKITRANTTKSKSGQKA